MFPYEFHFLGYHYNLVGYELNRDTNDASTIFICVPIGSVIVAFSGPTNITSRRRDGQNYSFPLCKGLEISHFPKYSVSGTAVH